MTTPREHVFLSYCRENVEEVWGLRRDLLAAGGSVWRDQELLPGQEWEFVIGEMMERSYAFALCLSRESDARLSSGVYPELLDAIEAYRRMRPGSVYIIPVRLSECTIPPIKIDATHAPPSSPKSGLAPWFPDARSVAV